MKKSIFLGAVMIALSLSVQADLVGDFVTGTSTGMTTFSGGSVEVTTGGPEFSGTIAGASSTEYLVGFDFGSDFLFIGIETDLSGTTYPTTFSVTFTDLDFGPGFILTGVTLNLDDPEDTFSGSYTRGEGLSAVVGDHSLTLDFVAFPVPEFRDIELGLVFEESGGGPGASVVPLPAPAAMVLSGMGLVGLVSRRKRA